MHVLRTRNLRTHLVYVATCSLSAPLVFTLFSGFITGSFMVYLSASQQIFEEQYHLKEEFPFIFAGLAVSIGLATFLNGKLVLRLGMYKLVSIFTVVFTIYLRVLYRSL